MLLNEEQEKELKEQFKGFKNIVFNESVISISESTNRLIKVTVDSFLTQSVRYESFNYMQQSPTLPTVKIELFNYYKIKKKIT